MELDLYQIYIKDPQLEFMSKQFKPFKNDIIDGFYEFGVFHRAFRDGLVLPDKLTGFLSWKFELKSYITAEEYIQFIQSKPGADIYIVNPFPELPHMHKNVWNQGGSYHPGFFPLAQELFDQLNYKVDLAKIEHRPEHWSFCNYWVGTHKFWTDYMTFANGFYELLNDASQPYFSELRKSANYHGGGSYLPFFFERLISTYLALKPQTKVVSFPWSEERIFRMISSMRDDVNRARAELEAPPPPSWMRQKLSRTKHFILGTSNK
jgi:hypothetical protein